MGRYPIDRKGEDGRKIKKKEAKRKEGKEKKERGEKEGEGNDNRLQEEGKKNDLDRD